ncbi:MAG: DUF421 domain-containing protein [Eubacteriales bacterium]
MLDELFKTALKSLVSIIILFILTRIMGKKQISQLTFFDYVAGISIGSIAASFAVDPSVGYLRGITAIIIYAIFPITLSYFTLKSYRARKLLDGMPSVIIQNGKILENNLKKTKLNVNDLLEECRLKNAFNIADIEFAVLETNGKLSVQLKTEKQPLTPKDMDIKTAYRGLCINVIIDGEIFDEHLTMSGKDRKWLIDELSSLGVFNYKNVLLAYIDANKELNVQLKNSDINKNPFM